MTKSEEGRIYFGNYVYNKDSTVATRKNIYWIFFGWAEEFKNSYRPDSDELSAYYWMELSSFASVEYALMGDKNIKRHPRDPENIVLPFKYVNSVDMLGEIASLAEVTLIK